MTRYICTLVLSLMLLGAQGVSARAQDGGEQTQGWSWLATPAEEAVSAAYPTRAEAFGQAGEAVITCLVTGRGLLTHCRIDSETPAGFGFGYAAITVASFGVVQKHQPGPMGARVYFKFVEPGIFVSQRPMRLTAPWIQTPTREQVDAVNPLKGRNEPFAHAAFACMILASGRLVKCKTLADAPINVGAAKAAKDLIKYFKVDPPGPGGSFAKKNVLVAVHFDNAAVDTGGDDIVSPSALAEPLPADLMLHPEAATVPGVSDALIECTVGADYKFHDCRAKRLFGDDRVERSALSYFASASAVRWTTTGMPTLGARVRLRLILRPPTITAP